MDLFYNILTPKQQLVKLKEEAKLQLGIETNWKSSNKKTAKTSFKLIAGEISNIADCILFVLPHVTTRGFFRTRPEKELIRTLNVYGIEKRIGTYAVLSESDSTSRQAVKNSTTILYRLIDILQPKLIVAMAEVTSEAFLSRKLKVADYHGTQITTHNNIPILYTYEMDYYSTNTGYENTDYKNNIYKNDWDYISKRYKEAFNATI